MNHDIASTPLDPLDHIEFGPDYAAIRVPAPMPLQEMVRMVSAGITHARQRHVHRLLIDSRSADGTPRATTTERYYFATEWANASGGTMRIAVLATPEQIDPDKIGVVVARNLGVDANIFSSEQEAIFWLLNDR